MIILFNVVIILFVLGVVVAPKAMGLLFALLMVIAFVMNVIGETAEQ